MKPKYWGDHSNRSVRDLEKSLEFYKRVFGLHELKYFELDDVRFWYLRDSTNSRHIFELSQLTNPTDLQKRGGYETHWAFRTSDYRASYLLHKEMGIIVEGEGDETSSVYFVTDPDGYWTTVLNSDFFPEI